MSKNNNPGGNPTIHPIHNRKYILLSKFQESNHHKNSDNV